MERHPELAYEALSDGELLSLARRDPEAFGVFFDRHFEFVLAFFYRRTADAQTAGDLAAETFAKAFVSRFRYRDTGAPGRAWLLGIARHEFSRFVRRAKVRDRARQRLGIERVVADDIAIDRVEDLLDMASLRHEVREALRTLPNGEARAVSLRIGMDLPYEEVAARLGCTPAAARTRVARGLHRLAESLGR